MTRVLIAGGTGAVGHRVVRSLLERGDEVRVLTRRAANARERLGPVDVHEGDVREAGTLMGVARDVDVVISTVGTRTFFGSNGGAAVDALGMKNLAAEVATEPSVRQLILLSAFGVDRKSPFLTAFSLAFNRYFRWKAEAERAVRDSGVPYTIVRPVEFNHRKRPPRQIRLNQSEPLTLLRTITRDLVAQTIVACVDNDDAINKTFEVCEGTGQAPIDEQLRTMHQDIARRLPARTPLF
jgi:uncharacterized protein YbjT (DUF2867 family)